VFPKHHPKAGQPTGFIEKIFHSIYKDKPSMFFDAKLGDIWLNPHLTGVKHHTIRSGNRWKVGDKSSPRVWSGKPYASKQIAIADDLEIKQIFDFQIANNEIYINGKKSSRSNIDLAINDGLDYKDLLNWFQFPKPFKGQIICWNESVNY
jgi:hypothetical protein